MKRYILTALFIITAISLFAGAKNISESENKSVQTAMADTISAAAVSEMAGAAVNADEPHFGSMTAEKITCCARDSRKPIDWLTLSPQDLGARWEYKIIHKDKPNEILDIVGLIESKTKINGEDYYYYCVPVENKGNLIRFTQDGAYIRRLKFPVFSWVFLDVELEPEIRYLQFPMKAGDEWSAESTGVVTLFGMFKVKQKTTTRFRVTGETDIPFGGKTVHVYKITNDIDKGEGKIVHEEDWFGLGIGLMYSNTETYTIELMKFTTDNEIAADVRGNTPPAK
jgi:hypothetical protein